MKHQYKTELIWKKIFQSFIDFFVDIYLKIFVRIEKPNILADPKKILVIILAQLGDVLVMSYVFPLIRERFQNSQIDVLIGEWTKPILENNPYINKIIIFNHFRMNRSEKSLIKKFFDHWKTSHDAHKKLHLEKYDLSIEGGVTYPNGNILSYRAKIKRRIGFGSGGFGSFLTDEVLFPPRRGFHILEAVLEELKQIGIGKSLAEIKPYFTIAEDSSIPTNYFDWRIDPFIIIHPESGNKKRTLSNKFWLEIVLKILDQKKYKIIVSGTSKKSVELINFILTQIPNSKENIINMINKLSLDEFFLLTKQANAAITLESLPAHLCSVSCPTLSFYKNGSGTFFFPIPNKSVIVVHNHKPSQNIQIHPLIQSYYIKEIESKEVSLLVENFIEQIAN